MTWGYHHQHRQLCQPRDYSLLSHVALATGASQQRPFFLDFGLSTRNLNISPSNIISRAVCGFVDTSSLQPLLWPQYSAIIVWNTALSIDQLLLFLFFGSHSPLVLKTKTSVRPLSVVSLLAIPLAPFPLGLYVFFLQRFKEHIPSLRNLPTRLRASVVRDDGGY